MRFDNVGSAPHLRGMETHSSQGFIRFESRDSEYKQLLDAVANESNYIIGLQGMGGTGKTTLAKEVGKGLEESGKFDLVIFTIVSNAPDIKKIQDNIAGPLGLSLKDKSEWERHTLLHKRLTNGQNILIILDDLWERINFDDIGIPSSGDSKNCRVLLTSRDVRVCNSMGCQRVIQLRLLSDQDAWLLFKKHAGMDDSFSKDFQDKGQEIKEECKGLPVAIAAIGSTLKNQPIEEWHVALTALRNPMPILDVKEGLTEIHKCLRYSYDNMKNHIVKRFFLLLSVLPINEELPTEALTRFAAGVGLFGEINKYNDTRNQVVVAKNTLIDSCLLLKAEKGHVKMHDLVREVALSIAKEDTQVIVLSEEGRKGLVKKDKKIKYLSCEDLQVGDMENFPNWFDVSRLEILIIVLEASDSVKVQNSFFDKMTSLRVLYLSNKALSKLDLTLPFSLQSLKNIRSLILVDWKLGDISVLGILQSLETLDLGSCSINELPNEIAKLEKLRLLTLEECEIERNNPFEVIGKCSQLEELYFTENNISELPILDDNINEIEVIHQSTSFLYLKRYQLHDEEVLNDSISKVVCLQNIDVLIPIAAFKYLVQGADILQLQGIKGAWTNLIPEIVPLEDEVMKDLIELKLKSCSKIQCLVNTTHGHSRVQKVFPKLVALSLKSMDNLEELCIGPLPVEFLKRLEKLHIKWCKNFQGTWFKSKPNLCNLKGMKLQGCAMLASLFHPSTARSLSLLEELRIQDCDQLTNIIFDEKSKGHEEVRLDADHKNYVPLFPKLRTLEIQNCHRLECVLTVTFPQDLPLLETIRIVDCNELKYIFGCHQHEDQNAVLGSLQNLKLVGLTNFINIFQECDTLMPTSSVKKSYSRKSFKAKHLNLNNKKILPWSCICYDPKKYGQKLRNATSIKSMAGQIDHSISSISNSSPYRVESAQGVTKQSPGLNIPTMHNIREIVLDKVTKMTSLFTISMASTLLLERLKITGCHGLKHIIMDTRDDKNRKNCISIFPRLKEIYVSTCDQLVYVIGQNHHADHNHNLQIHIDLPALEQLTLESLSNMINFCPILSYVMKLSSLKKFKLDKCPQFIINPVGDLLVSSDQRESISTNNKEFESSSIECIQSCNLADFVLGNSPLDVLNIREMTLENCPKIMSLFTFSVASTMLLEKLTISGCHGLKHIIIDMINDENRKNCGSIFPKVREIFISSCDQLEYVMGHNHNEDRSHNIGIQVDFPALEVIILKSVSNMINFCPINYVIKCSSIKKFVLDECPKFIINPISVSDLVVAPYSRQAISTTNKDKGTRGIEKHFHTLETINIANNKVECIFHESGLEIMDQPISIGLQYVYLYDLPQMSYICVASKNSLTFPHLKVLVITGCEKLEVIFHESVLRCLPELKHLEIMECKELKHIVEHDEKLSPQACFPNLAALIVRECHKLKRIFSYSATNDNVLPNVQLVIINGACELEEIFACEQGQIGKVKAMLPKLSVMIFMHLSSLCLGGELETVRHLVVYNCPKLSLIPTASLQEFRKNFGRNRKELEITDRFFPNHIVFKMINRGTMEATNIFQDGPETQTASRSELISFEITEESEKEFVGKVTGSEITEITTGEPFLMNQPNPLGGTESTIDISEGINTGVEEGSTSNGAMIVASSTNSELAKSLSGPLVTTQNKSDELQLDPVSEATSQSQMNHQVPATSESEVPSSQAKDANQSMLERESKGMPHIQLLEQKSSSISSPSLIESTKKGVEEETTSEIANIVTLSTQLEPASSQPDPSVSPQSKSYPCIEIRLSQAETYTDKESEGHPVNIQDFMDEDLMSLFQPEEESSDGQIATTPPVSVVSTEYLVMEDNLVVKILADVEESLKMPLKDIASSEANTVRLLRALNFLSKLSLEHVTLSEELKTIIDSLQKEFPSILCSFKQAFATTNKFAVLEEKELSMKGELDHRKDVAIALSSKISKAKNFMVEAQQKEAILKEQMNRLEKEMEDCEANLSSLQEERKKFVAETIGYKKEFETVRNDKSHMVEDQRKAQKELFEVDYKWSILCSQFEHNRIIANNPS